MATLVNKSKANTMKILNLYAGIGGNRKLWSDKHEITAVEYDEDIANIYKDYYTKDEVIVADAHQFLLENYMNYDFIWSSPPCPTHSRLCISWKNNPPYQKHIRYPEMSLYQEIILLQHFSNAYFVVENVIPYYKPLINPTIELHRHYFWSNFEITKKKFKDERKHDEIETNSILYGYDLKDKKHNDKRKLLRNMVNPEVGKHILDCLEVEIFNKNNKLF